MAIIFPDEPTANQIFTSGNQSWRWDGIAWIGTGAPLAAYVTKTGDAMSGPLTVPAGATGAQVPRVDEVAKLVGAAFTGAITAPSLRAVVQGAGILPVVDAGSSSGMPVRIEDGDGDLLSGIGDKLIRAGNAILQSPGVKAYWGSNMQAFAGDKRLGDGYVWILDTDNVKLVKHVSATNLHVYEEITAQGFYTYGRAHVAYTTQKTMNWSEANVQVPSASDGVAGYGPDALGLSTHFISRLPAAGITYHALYRANNGATQAYISNAGVVAHSGLLALSDITTKTDIELLVGGLDLVLALNPVTYMRDGEERAGFVAQQVQSVFPRAVKPFDDGKLGVDSDAILSACVAAIRELAARCLSK